MNHQEWKYTLANFECKYVVNQYLNGLRKALTCLIAVHVRLLILKKNAHCTLLNYYNHLGLDFSFIFFFEISKYLKY